MLKRYKHIFGVLLIIFAAILASFYISQRQQAPTEPPYLLLDAKDEASLPVHFRTMQGPWREAASYEPSRVGLESLRASGSSQFSAGQLREMMQFIGNPVILVDLREESHGFLNGMAVSWADQSNWANRGKNFADVLTTEATELRALRGMRQAKVAMAPLKKEKTAEFQSVNIDSVISEEDLAIQDQIGYFRITATDHIGPSDENIDRFVEFVKQLPADTWLHFHCREGHGRTTTFLLLYDILRNGKTVPLEDLAIRQYRLGGVDLLNQAPAEPGDRREAYLKRAQTIRLFYDYVVSSPAALPIPWSEWVATRR